MSQLPLLPPEPVMSLKIIVQGDPRGKGRHRSRIVQPKFKPAFIHNYADPETEKYEAVIARYGQLTRGGRGLLLGALHIQVTAYMPIPMSWSEKKKQQARDGHIRPIVKPDWDNFGKVASDALNGVIWKDDAQIVDGRVSKFYSEEPRLEIEIFTA